MINSKLKIPLPYTDRLEKMRTDIYMKLHIKLQGRVHFKLTHFTI